MEKVDVFVCLAAGQPTGEKPGQMSSGSFRSSTTCALNKSTGSQLEVVEQFFPCMSILSDRMKSFEIKGHP